MRRLLFITLATTMSWACAFDFEAPFEGRGYRAQGGGGRGGGSNVGGSTAGEVCGNGLDDDGDTLIDCADPECGQLECIAPVPSGWTGPIGFSDTAGATCPPGFSSGIDVGSAVKASPATCSSCACGSSTITCSLPQVQLWPSLSCLSGTPRTLSPTVQKPCVSFTNVSVVAIVGSLPTVESVSCPASGGSASKTTATWVSKARVCIPPPDAAGCGADQICAAQLSGAFRTCLMQDGTHTCPSGYPEETLMYRRITDTRACTKCSCTPPTNAACSATTELWDGNETCKSLVDGMYEHDGNCEQDPYGPIDKGSVLVQSSGTAGSCSTSGGSPTGEARPSGALTICCAPR